MCVLRAQLFTTKVLQQELQINRSLSLRQMTALQSTFGAVLFTSAQDRVWRDCNVCRQITAAASSFISSALPCATRIPAPRYDRLTARRAPLRLPLLQLIQGVGGRNGRRKQIAATRCGRNENHGLPHSGLQRRVAAVAGAGAMRHHRHESRSEEHTSELQSRENIVCRLLLEKKK